MRNFSLIFIVVALHCAAIGSLIFIQGCGATSKMQGPPPVPIMPPPIPPVAKPVLPPLPEKAALPQKPVKRPMLPPQVKPGKTTVYVVKPGDCLSKIAQQFNVEQSDIIKLNNLKDSNKIRAGQKLIVPYRFEIEHHPVPSVIEQEKPGAFISEPPVKAETGSKKEYIVRAGDTLSKIAVRFGTTVEKLQKRNNLHSDKILIGQKLIISAPGESIAPGEAGEETESWISGEGEKKAVELKPLTTEETSEVEGTSGIVHVVQPDETIESIARLYAVSIEELADLNHLSQNDQVHPGQHLTIP